MSIYQLPPEIITIIVKYVPFELHCILKHIKFFVPYIIGKSRINPLMIYSAQYGYANILREFLRYAICDGSLIIKLCNYIIMNDHLDCLKVLCAYGVKCNRLWLNNAAYFAPRIFKYLFPLHYTIGIDIVTCCVNAISAGNTDIITLLQDLSISRDDLIDAIRHQKLAVIKPLIKNFRGRNDPYFVALAIFLYKKDILDYLISENFVISIPFIAKFTKLKWYHIEKIKDILVYLSLKIEDKSDDLIKIAEDLH